MVGGIRLERCAEYVRNTRAASSESAHVVARDGEAVLAGRDAAAGSVEIRRRFGLPGRPVGDAEREQHEQEEDDDGRDVQALFFYRALDRTGRPGCARVATGRLHRRNGRETPHLPISCLTWSVRSS